MNSYSEEPGPFLSDFLELMFATEFTMAPKLIEKPFEYLPITKNGGKIRRFLQLTVMAEITSVR